MREVFRKMDVRSTLVAGLLGAILFCIPVIIYIARASYDDAWMLYMGSFAFLIVMSTHTMRDSMKRGNNESTVTLSFNSHMATIAGVVISCLLSFIILSIQVPGYLGPSEADTVLTGEPANSVIDKTDGMSFHIFMAAAVINFSVGSFVGIMIPFAVKRNQKRDSRDPAPLHQSGRR